MARSKQNHLFNSLMQHTFPLPYSPLVQCVTNEITCESLANALLYLGAKPVMADEAREFAEFFEQTDSLLLNLGHISAERERSLLAAARLAEQTNKPFIIDLVGVAATALRYDLAHKLAAFQPAVIKGNISEMRAYCGLKSNARGVDASNEDQKKHALLELEQAMKQAAQRNLKTIYLATGKIDLVVSSRQSLFLANGVPELDRFTGTGDIVGALIAAFLGTGRTALEATVSAVTYFNLCGEVACKCTQGLANFRQETLNQLSLLFENKDWFKGSQGGTI